MKHGDKTVLLAPLAPPPIGPYSQAIKQGNMLFLAGQIALDPKTGKLVGNDIPSQTDQVMKNIEAIIEFAGLTMGHIVRCVIYTTDLGQTQAVNQIYGKRFVFEPPVRTTIQVAALPAGALIEIEATAMFPPKGPVDYGQF